MEESVAKKLRLLYLLDILKSKTDEEHQLTLEEIMIEMAKYNIVAERKTYYSDFKLLEEYGYNIVKNKSNITRYFLGEREFEVSELKLLVDAILSSKFITKTKTKELIDKLGKFTSEYQAEQLERDVFIGDRVKSMNESVFYRIDEIHSAISHGVQMKFEYFELVIEGRKIKKKLKHSGKLYHVDPIYMQYQDECYYLKAYDRDDDKEKNFRVDKIKSIEILTEPQMEKNKNRVIDTGNISKMTFNMYGGKEINLSIKFHNSVISVIVDKFGMDVCITKFEKEHFIINQSVQVSSTFYGWLANLGVNAEILEPATEREKYIKHIEGICGVYKGDIK